jgi:hypothetical protein
METKQKKKKKCHMKPPSGKKVSKGERSEKITPLKVDTTFSIMKYCLTIVISVLKKRNYPQTHNAQYP